MQTSPSTNIARPVQLADPVNRSHPLNAGRVAWWLTLPGLDGGATWYDLMGLNNATLTGMGNSTNGWRATTRPGGFGRMLFDGSSKCLGPGAAPIAGNDYSIAAWVQVGGGGSYRAAWSDTGADRFLGVDGSAKPYAQFFTGGFPSITAPTALDGGWHHLVMVKSSTAGLLLYADGLLATSNGALTATGTIGSGFAIGSQPEGGSGWVGSIDDGSLWNRQLSAAEVSACYDLSRRGYPGVLNRR